MAEPAAVETPLIEVRDLTVTAGHRTLLRRIQLQVPNLGSLAIVGPSGVGKSTLLRCLNRLIDLTPDLQVSGHVCYRGTSIHGSSIDVDALRSRVAILFQQPAVFPRSIRQNVLFGVRHLGTVQRRQWEEVTVRALVEAALWDEVKDRLDDSALKLSVGQQQRLCLARSLALNPEVLLLDEPTSALDARSTEAVEQSLLGLKGRRTLLLVTHNLAQARRLTTWTVCLERRDGAGEMARSLPSEALEGSIVPSEAASD